MNLVPAKIPKWVRLLGVGLTFRIPTEKKEVFLTFDDGPIPDLTPWVLEELSKHNAKATFFMVGENVEKHPELVKSILIDGHRIGNHTHNHLNGFKVSILQYLNNTEKCEKGLEPYLNPNETKLFRPPYGRLTPREIVKLKKRGFKIILWDVLSKDYDPKTSPSECVNNVVQNVVPGSIIVMHENLKASKNVKEALPEILRHLKNDGYSFSVL
jgi:peptidoglycan/xylan/chitin deacetylase (PgdA/CDA1 family)